MLPLWGDLVSDLDKIKYLINEKDYPYFSDTELQDRLDDTDDLYNLAQELCLIKAGIEEMRLGDVVIPSPRRHFLMLAAKYRGNHTGTVVRADGC